MEGLYTINGRFAVAATLYLFHHKIIVTSAGSLPCSRLGNSLTGEPCLTTTPPTLSPVTPTADKPEALLSSPYVFVVLCSLVFVPFLILLKVWWVKRLQKVQYVQRREDARREETEIYVIDPAVFAPPPSYEECMTKSPSYDCLPAYEDLKFGPEGKPYVSTEEAGTSTEPS